MLLARDIGKEIVGEKRNAVGIRRVMRRHRNGRFLVKGTRPDRLRPSEEPSPHRLTTRIALRAPRADHAPRLRA